MVVHLHVFNASGELFLQHRAETKDVQPGRWDTSVGGHVDFGESIHDALKREASEELGLVDINSELLYDSSRKRGTKMLLQKVATNKTSFHVKEIGFIKRIL